MDRDMHEKPMFFYHPRWPVLHDDNHLLALYKPAGVIMQRGAHGKAGLVDMAKAWLKQRYAKPGQVFVGMVQRLDGPVAGVVVLARTSKAASRLSAQIRAATLSKCYLAVVIGRPPRTADRLVSRLVRSGRFSRPVEPASTGDAAGPSGKNEALELSDNRNGGRQARLSYELLEAGNGRSLLSVRLETGRRHQIRAQLSQMGCPIQGDVHYGAPQPLPDGRIALLSSRVTFAHPTRGCEVVIESPLPAGWPWPDGDLPSGGRPWWTLEELRRDGLVLPNFASNQ